MDEQPTVASPRPADHDSGDGRPQLSQVDVTLEHLGRLCSRLEQAEQRFKQMTDECSSVLDGLVSVDRRHATTLATLNDRLGDWCNIERKLLEESARRIERFERGVEHEWTALRRLHEEPISDLRDQADKLRLACLDAARLARQRLDAAEQAYTLQTSNFERRMAEWTRRVMQAATGRELPGFSTDGTEPAMDLAASSHPQVEPWPLDGVAQLHQELRSGSQAPPRPRSAPPANERVESPLAASEVAQDQAPHAGPVSPAVPHATAADEAAADEASEANDELAAVVSREAAADASTYGAANRNPRLHARIVWAVFAIVVGIVVYVTASYINQMQRRLLDLESRASEAAHQSKPSGEAAQSVAAEPRTPDAQQVAQRAGVMVNILAAPDLVRYDLAGVGAGQGAYAQVLWSRSHGMALTAMRLPSVAGKVYRVWVSRDGRTATAGVLGSDGAGTARLIVPGPLTLPRPGTIIVTLENAVSAEQPAGPIYLTRVPTS